MTYDVSEVLEALQGREVLVTCGQVPNPVTGKGETLLPSWVVRGVLGRYAALDGVYDVMADVVLPDGVQTQLGACLFCKEDVQEIKPPFLATVTVKGSTGDGQSIQAEERSITVPHRIVLKHPREDVRRKSWYDLMTGRGGN